MIPWIPICLALIVAVLWYYHSVCLICLQKTHTYAFLMYHVVARWRFSLSHASMTDPKYTAGRKLLRKGHIIFTRDNRALSTWLVPGHHTHVLLCIGEIDGIMMCAEMTRDDYDEVSFAKAAWHSSAFDIGECPDWDPAYTDLVVKKCRSFKDADYDTLFDVENDDECCTELVYHSDVDNRLGVVPTRAWTTGKLIVTPDNLASNVDIIYDSDEEQV